MFRAARMAGFVTERLRRCAGGSTSIPGQATALRIEGYNVDAQSLPLGQAEKKTGSKPAFRTGNR
jgi:hypothetical protein